MNIIITIIFIITTPLLAGCAATGMSQLPSGMVLCSDGVWGRVIGANISQDVAGTKGGAFNIKCAAGEINTKDAGDLTPAGQSVRVPVDATPMKLTPK